MSRRPILRPAGALLWEFDMLGTPARYAPFIDLSRGDLELLIALLQLRPAPGRRKRLALRLRVSEAAVKSRLMHLYLVTGLASMEDLADWWDEHRTEYVVWVAHRVGLEADDLRAALEGAVSVSRRLKDSTGAVVETRPGFSRAYSGRATGAWHEGD